MTMMRMIATRTQIQMGIFISSSLETVKSTLCPASSRRQASRSLRTDLCLDAREQAICSRKNEGLGELVYQSDSGAY
jgi:hypothetical protein